MKPFADNTSTGIGAMTIENAADKVVLYGSLELTRDKAGLHHAEALVALAQAVLDALRADPALPAAAPAPKPARKVKNPFGS